jgi:hypothetical protein
MPGNDAPPSEAQPYDYAPPALPPKKRFLSGWRLYAAIGAGIFVGLMIIGLLAGEDENKDSSGSSASVASQPSPQATTAPAATVRVAATAQPTQRPQTTPTPQASGPLLLKNITPVALNLPRPPADALGSNNVVAAEQIRSAIGTSVQDLSGVDVTVHRWLARQDSIVVIDMDEAATKRFPTDPKPVLNAIVGSPAVKTFNVTEVSLITAGRDSQGTYTIIATMTLPTAQALVHGQLSEQQMRNQVKASQVRP